MRAVLPALLLALPAAAEYLDIHGVHMYYESHGEGPPVVLLHGGLNTIQTSFAPNIAFLARNHRVIAIEQMGHGHTPDVAGRDMSYAAMAEDTAALLEKLGIQNADFVGFSDGAQLALRLAYTHPSLVRRVVASGVGLGELTPDQQKGTRSIPPNALPKFMHDDYNKVSPDGPAHWPVVVHRVLDMWATPGWGLSEAELKTIKAKVMLLFGDHDFTKPEEAIRIFRDIPGAQLCILPGTGHATFRDRPDWLNPIVADFLNK